MAAPSPSEQQRAYAALATLSQRDLAKLWAKLDLGKPDRLADPLTEILDALVGHYGTGAAALAADWYEDARAAAVSGSFTAVTASPPDADRLGALSRWGVGPLFGAKPDGALALSLIVGGLQRLVVGMGRQTTELSVHADPARPRYARHASANACTFCAMLASRGDAYTSESSAGFVGGRGVDTSANVPGTRGRRAGGIRARGTQALGEKYHDHCHCVPVVVWPGQTYTPAPYVAKWDQAYIDARKAGATTTTETLAKMRETLGTN